MKKSVFTKDVVSEHGNKYFVQIIHEHHNSMLVRQTLRFLLSFNNNLVYSRNYSLGEAGFRKYFDDYKQCIIDNVKQYEENVARENEANKEHNLMINQLTEWDGHICS